MITNENESIEIFSFCAKSHNKIPLFTMSVSAGIPMPVENDVEKHIDLNEFLVDHPASTFFARVSGDLMKDIGIFNGDILIVDSSVDPVDGKIIVAMLNNELTIRYYRNIDGQEYLESHSSQFLPLKLGALNFKILGTVTKIIHSL